MSPTTAWMTAARVALVAAVACGGVGALVLGGVASAAEWRPEPETGAPGGLVLERDAGMGGAGSLAELSPGDPVRWQIRTTVDHHSETVLDLELRKGGALADADGGLEVTVRSCDDPWADGAGAPTCQAGAGEVTWAAPQHDYGESSPSFRVPDGHGDSEVFLLVEFALPDTPEAAGDESLMGLTASVAVGVTATDAPPPTPTPSPDAGTGTGPGAATMPAGSPTTLTEGAADSPTSPTALPTGLAWTGASTIGALLVASAAVLSGLTAAAVARSRRRSA